jgi:outer membrane scaffolding protein for murein synthesis (MipA/OmpV family)
MKSNIWTGMLLAVFCSLNLSSSLVLAAAPATEISTANKIQSETLFSKNELDFTFYLRIETIIQNRLYNDSGQRNLLDYLGLSVGLDAYYGRFFIESSNRFYQNSQTATLGYRLADMKNYQLDILLGQSYMNYLDQNHGNVYREEPSEALAGIDIRGGDINQGVRFTQFHSNKAWWIDVAGDLLTDSHGGWLVDAYFSQLYQIKNWEVQFGFGATYFSNQMVDYYSGIKAHEVTAERPLYKAGNGTRVSMDVSAQLPLSNTWIFFAGAAFKGYSAAFSDSPLYKRGHQTSLNMGVMYVW